MKIGQTQQFNVNNDTYYDLNVTLNSINAGKVNVTILKVHELLPSVINGAAQKPSSQGSGATASGSGNTESPSPSTSTPKKPLINGYTYLIVGIIIVLVVFLIFQRRMRR